MTGPLDVDRGDPLVGLRVALGLEGRGADQELVAQHSQGPQINLGDTKNSFVKLRPCRFPGLPTHFFVVRGSVDHLRGQVVEGAAHRGSAGGGRVDRPAKVGDLEVALHVQEQVLRLDITMNYLESRRKP